jgi:hypothetical protein
MPSRALIERELRRAMQRHHLKTLPIYRKKRRRARPTTEQILRLYAHAQSHTLLRQGRVIQAFEGALTPRQQQALDLPGVPSTAFRG